MPDETRIIAPGSEKRNVRSADGQIRHAPDRKLLPIGDATLAQRVKVIRSNWTPALLGQSRLPQR